MQSLPYFVIGLIVVAVVVILVIVSSRMRKGDQDVDPLQARLAEYSQRGEVTSLEEIELTQSFTERVLIPFMQRLGEFSVRFTPQKALEDTRRKLELAGSPGGVDAATLLASRFVVAAFLGGLVFIVGFAASNWPASRVILVGLLFTVIGFFLPQLWLQSKIDRRQKEIRKAMPDALDLLTICVEAGLGFDAAMSKVSEKWENELSVAFRRAIREVQLGKLRREALKDMSERIGLAEMTSFVAAVVQSEQLGVSMARVLRIQSEQMRMKRRQRAEEEAHSAPVKMILPMVFLTFPSILIVLLTPALLQMIGTFSVFSK